METGVLNKSWFSSVIYYSMLFWTILCVIGTWFVILKHGILLEGLIAVVTTFFFAATIWVIPLTGLILISLWVPPAEAPPSRFMFKELIKKGIRKS